MRYITFAPEHSNYPVAILTRQLRERELRDYVHGLENVTVAYAIDYNPKAKNDEIKAWLGNLLPTLASLRTQYLVVTEGSLFKVLTKTAQVSKQLGYVLPCVLKGFEHFHVVYVPSPGQLIYDPSLMHKVNQGLDALRAHRAGKYLPPGSDVLKVAHYLDDVCEIEAWLEKLLDVDLACDIEAYSLKHYDAGIGTIAFAWNQHEGIAFAVDKDNPPEKAGLIRALLKNFFIRRTGRTLYHNGAYDIYVLIYQLFMHDLLDTAGLLFGLELMLRNWDDTQLITYLATNSCAGNKLSLKEQAQEFLGDYAEDVKDINLVPLPKLLTYNLKDACGTWYVYNKRHPQMVADLQQAIYVELFRPAIADIIQMQLTGLPIDMAAVAEGKAVMEADRNKAVYTIMRSQAVHDATLLLNEKWVEKRNSELKIKRVSLADAKEVFNINSGPQLIMLLHDVMQLPVLSTTDTGLPATGMEDLKGLIHHAKTDEHREVLQALIDYKAVDKILTSFIPAFENAKLGPDGWYYLFGFFNLGGTLSGRLSSNDPNLQNIPATGTKYAKIIKKMFKAPKGWLFVGLDFASLEDRISALTTKDPNKLKVYTDGYDGHSLRAYAYFGDQMPDIDPTSVDSINSIADKYKPLRQSSKAPTFALTYQGTWRTLVTNCGFSEKVAKEIEERYHEMYIVSDYWVQQQLKQAAKDGYVTIAFGLRLRTPMLKQTVAGTKSTPYEATAEGRTAGNAMGQSYGLLNTRAGMAFMRKVRESQWRLDIKPCAQIHDAQYYLVRNDADLLAWMNIELVVEVQWQELPAIQHDEVKLGGELSVFYPTWNDELQIPNGADADQILQLAMEHLAK